MNNILNRLAQWMGYDVIARPKSGFRQQCAWDKVFCVGANKTGTTPKTSVLQGFGIRMPVQSVQETILKRRILGSNLQIFGKFFAPFDAFQDLPFSTGLNCVALDVLFPDARFILTLHDPEDWFKSVCAFENKVLGMDTFAAGCEHSFHSATPYVDDDYATNIMTHNLLRVT